MEIISLVLTLNIIYFVYKYCNFNFPLKGSYIYDDFDGDIIVMHNSIPYIFIVLLFLCAINYNLLFIIGYLSFILNIFFLYKK